MACWFFQQKIHVRYQQQKDETKCKQHFGKASVLFYRNTPEI